MSKRGERNRGLEVHLVLFWEVSIYLYDTRGRPREKSTALHLFSFCAVRIEHVVSTQVLSVSAAILLVICSLF